MKKVAKPASAKPPAKAAPKSAKGRKPAAPSDEDLPVVTDDPKLKFLEGLTPFQIDFHDDHWRIRDTLHYTRVDTPDGPRMKVRRKVYGELTRDAQLRLRLAETQDVCRRLGWAVPVGLAPSGEPHYGQDGNGRYLTTPPARPTAVAAPPDAGPTTVRPAAGKKPGVVAKIVEILRAASKKNPVTKEEVLKQLVAAFPERSPQAMKSTVASQIPSCLRIEKKLIVETDKKGGFWLPPAKK